MTSNRPSAIIKMQSGKRIQEKRKAKRKVWASKFFERAFRKQMRSWTMQCERKHCGRLREREASPMGVLEPQHLNSFGLIGRSFRKSDCWILTKGQRPGSSIEIEALLPVSPSWFAEWYRHKKSNPSGTLLRRNKIANEDGKRRKTYKLFVSGFVGIQQTQKVR